MAGIHGWGVLGLCIQLNKGPSAQFVTECDKNVAGVCLEVESSMYFVLDWVRPTRCSICSLFRSGTMAPTGSMEGASCWIFAYNLLLELIPELNLRPMPKYHNLPIR